MTMADKNAFVLQDDCSYCGAPFSDAHPIEPLGASSWNPNQG